MTTSDVDTWKRELLHDVCNPTLHTQPQASQQPPIADHVARDSHWLGEMLHPDDTTTNGW